MKTTMYVIGSTFFAAFGFCLSGIASSHPGAVQTLQHHNFPNSRIIGGYVAKENAAPFVVALVLNFADQVGGKFCAGTLISDQHILTAAQCVIGTKKNSIRMGVRKLFSEVHKVVQDAEFTFHDEFNDTTYQNDIAVIKLPQPVTLDNHINKMSLPQRGANYENKRGRIFGWGYTHDGSADLSKELRYVDVLTISNKQCSESGQKISDGNICTSSNSPIESVKVGYCIEDTGGPLIVNNVVVGVISFPPQPCEKGHPSVYTRVDHYLDWVQSAIQKLG